MNEALTEHQLSAAVTVAHLIDRAGNDVEDARASYRQALTEGQHPLEDLASAELVLLNTGLLVRTGERLAPTELLRVLGGLHLDAAKEALRARVATLTERDLQAERDANGAAGEEAIVAACRTELHELGAPELAAQVQRVSLVSDTFGYDVLAPRLDGRRRLIEVKAQRGSVIDRFRFFLSRNEFDTGCRDHDWSLAACSLPGPTGDYRADIVGWCSADALHPYLPKDGGGKWTEALVHLPVAALVPGYPPAL
jgi:hypothetical protein